MAEGRVADEEQPTIMETFRFLWSKRPFRHMAVGGGLTAFVGYGVITWVPSFLIRSYGMNTGDVGTYLGLILGIPGGIGIALVDISPIAMAHETRAGIVDRVGSAHRLNAAIWCLPEQHCLRQPQFLIPPILLGNFTKQRPSPKLKVSHSNAISSGRSVALYSEYDRPWRRPSSGWHSL